jgi:hypothetical protein
MVSIKPKWRQFSYRKESYAMTDLLEGSGNRQQSQVEHLRAKVNQGQVSALEAAAGPIINPGALNHAHTRKARSTPPMQLGFDL